jgi:hypothetical protein
MLRKLYVSAFVASVAVLALASNALAATSVSAPTLDPGAYADGVLDALTANLTALFVIGGIFAGIGGVIALTRRFGRVRSS